MAQSQGWDAQGFHNHAFLPIGPEGPVFCLWESSADVSADDFQAFVDGPEGPGEGRVFDNAVSKVSGEPAKGAVNPPSFFADFM